MLGIHPMRSRLGSWLRHARRSPLLYWTGVLVTIAIISGAVGEAFDRAEQRQEQFGSTRRVLVATHTLPAGHELGADDVKALDMPEAMLATSALSQLDSPSRLRSPVIENEVLVAERLEFDPTSALAAATPAQHRSIAIPTDGARLDLKPEDRVDVYAIDPSTGQARPIASHAIVVSTDDRAVTVAVTLDEVPVLATSIVAGTLVITLIGASP